MTTTNDTTANRRRRHEIIVTTESLGAERVHGTINGRPFFASYGFPGMSLSGGVWTTYADAECNDGEFTRGERSAIGRVLTQRHAQWFNGEQGEEQ